MAFDVTQLRLLQCPYERDDRVMADEHQRLLSQGRCQFGHRWQESPAGQRLIPPYICTEQLYEQCQAPLVNVGQSQSMKRCLGGFHPTRVQLANLDNLNTVVANVLWEQGITSEQCAICLGMLGSASAGRFGHLKNCAHVFCGNCLIGWFDQREEQQARLQCPVCRTDLGESGILIWPRVLTDLPEKAELFCMLRPRVLAPRQEVRDAQPEVQVLQVPTPQVPALRVPGQQVNGPMDRANYGNVAFNAALLQAFQDVQFGITQYPNIAQIGFWQVAPQPPVQLYQAPPPAAFNLPQFCPCGRDQLWHLYFHH